MLHCLVARRAYVPSTSESKESGGTGVVAEKGGAWVKGRKDRMKRKKKQDQTRAIRADLKGKKGNMLDKV